MGKKPNVHKLNPMAKNPGPSSETPVNDLDNRVSDPIVSKIPSNINCVFVRRSRRLQSASKPVKNGEVEEVHLIESENEDEPHVGQKIPDEKVDDLGKAVEEFIYEETNADIPFEGTSASLYKSLYFDSQKKVEALTSENQGLARKLEIALGKLEVHENINDASQAIAISNLQKVIEALVRAMPHARRFSSEGPPEVDGGGAVLKGSSAKKRRHEQTSK